MLKARLDEAQGRPVTPAAATVEKLLTDWIRDVVEPKGRGGPTSRTSTTAGCT